MLEVGQYLQLGRYCIKEQLSQGGMGTVYLATDRNLADRVVALKENTDTSPATQEQFQREAAVLARLTHPNLPRVTDHFIEPSGRQYLVMDYVAGEDFRQIMLRRDKPLLEAEALAWIKQVMDALEHMHTWINIETGQPSPIVHRDIKPGNIKRTPNGRIVLVDFGLAKYQTGEDTFIGARAVTAGYSPIEQYTGGTDRRSDIYALGATLYTLLTHEKPPDAPTLASGTQLIPPRKLNPQISRNTERVILRAMHVQPGERFQNIQEMRGALFGKGATNSAPDLFTAIPTNSEDDEPTQRPQRSPLPRLQIWGIMLLLALLSVVVAVIAIDLPATVQQGWVLIANLAQAETATPTSSAPTDTPPPPSTASSETPVQPGALFTATTSISATQLPTSPQQVAVTAAITPTATQAFTSSPTPSPTSSPTSLPTATLDQQATAAAAAQLSTVITATLVALPTDTLTSTPTAAPTLLPTATATEIPSATPSATTTDTPIPEPTATPLPSPTAPPSATPTGTPTPTSTPLSTSTTTNTPLPPPTVTPSVTATPQPTLTPSPINTATPTPLPTVTVTNTPAPTPTTTPLPSPTPTVTATSTPLATNTPTVTRTPLPTATATPLPTTTPSPTLAATRTPTALPTLTPTPLPTPTRTPTVTATATARPTATATVRPTNTATRTATSTPRPTLTPTRATPAAGATRVSAVDDAVYVFIPAGEFTMGSSTEAREQPEHTVALAGFWIMKTEVTNAEYARCVEAGRCTAPQNETWDDPANADHPVTNVDWNQASAYATWVNGRLPTEAEWEKAARGTDTRTYPWGEELPGELLLNFNLVEGKTTPVGSYPEGASPYGVLDMAGNVEEWVADWYADAYYASSPAQNPPGPTDGDTRVIRGGSFNSQRAGIRTSARDATFPDAAFDTLGFRVVRSDL